MPVFRPVIGFDKQEIVDVSEKIGTYETSIQPYEDCCTIFVAKHPVTKPNINVIHSSERRLEEKIDQLVETALETTEQILCKERKICRYNLETYTKKSLPRQTLMVSDGLCALSRCPGSER